MTHPTCRGGKFSRPRLLEHVLARRHRLGNSEFVLLFDTDGDRLLRLGLREWRLLAQADGTRDLRGIRDAYLREGGRSSPESVRAFFESLWDQGFLADGLDVHGQEASLGLLPSVTVQTLPNYTFRCDGNGDCCRSYASVLSSGPEARRAMVLCADLLGESPLAEDLFCPARGTQPYGGLAVLQQDGACLFYREGGCAIHRRGGSSAKPMGCQLYPFQFVDDGVSVWAVPRVECACVLASLSSEKPGNGCGERSWQDESGKIRSPEAIQVVSLPERIAVWQTWTWPREAYRQWAEIARVPFDGDVVSWLWAASSRLGPSMLPPRSSSAIEFPDEGELVAALEALCGDIRRLRAQLLAWRAPGDGLTASVSQLLEAAELLRDNPSKEFGRPASPSTRAHEEFYRQVFLYEHAWCEKGVDLRTGLRERAFCLLLARSHASLSSGAGTDYFLATIERLFRAWGLGRGAAARWSESIHKSEA